MIHTDAMYSRKLLYKLQLALARDANCNSLSLQVEILMESSE